MQNRARLDSALVIHHSAFPCTSCLSPSAHTATCIRSSDSAPCCAIMPWWFPRSVIRRMFDAADRFVIDPLIAPPVNQLRAEVRLPPVSGIFRDYIHSPQLVIGMFPEWFAPPPPDWPKQVRLTGFPLYDEAELEPMSEEIYDFINAGDPPFVFTPGSANHHA